MGAGGGHGDPPVHGEEPAIGEVQLPGPEMGCQLVGQGVLAVEVAADRGGFPPAGSGVQQAGQPQQRPGAGRGNPERGRERGIGGHFQGGAVDLGDLQAERGPVSSGGNPGPGRVGLEHSPCRVLPVPGPGLGVGRAGRHRDAGPGRHPGQAEDQGEHTVVAQHREQRTRDQAQSGDLRIQRPVQQVTVPCPGRRSKRPAGQQRFQQALPSQVSQPVLVLPQARPGRHPGRQSLRPRRSRIIAGSGRDQDGHGKIRRQRGSCDWQVWIRHPPS